MAAGDARQVYLVRLFNLKGELLIEHRPNDDPLPGRMIYPEPMRMASFAAAQDRKRGWVRQNFGPSEEVMRREDVVEDEMLAAAREWMEHVEAGRIG